MQVIEKYVSGFPIQSSNNYTQVETGKSKYRPKGALQIERTITEGIGNAPGILSQSNNGIEYSVRRSNKFITTPKGNIVSKQAEFIQKQVGKNLFFFQPNGNAFTKPIIDTLSMAKETIIENTKRLKLSGADLLMARETTQDITNKILKLKWLKVK